MTDMNRVTGTTLAELTRGGWGYRLRIGPEDRDELVAMATASFPGGVFRKTARIVAVQARGPFTVDTDRGPMTGEAGDWIATNHPDDDPGSDVWTISADRMDATYVRTIDQGSVDDEPDLAPETRIRRAIKQLGTPGAASSRHKALAITKLEEALLWLGAEDIL